jgi:voltage-gated potassium channel Kch
MARQHATILVAIVTCTMALTPVLVALTPRLLPKAKVQGREESFDDANGSVLLIGFGRFGQVLSQLLLAEGLEITAIDNSVEMIEAAERFGFRVYYGDGKRLDVLRAAGVDRAKLVCVCVETAATANEIVKGLKEVCPNTKLYVRAYDRVHALDLLKLGVDYQLRETYESAVVFGRAVLEGLELDPDRINQVEEEVRRRERERFAIQVQGGDLVMPGQFASRPIPRPEPLIEPRSKAVTLNPEDLPREDPKPPAQA